MLKPNSNIAKTYHADPEARIYNGRYYIYATKSRAYSQQKNIDLYVSSDGEKWKEIKDIIDMSTFPYAWQAVWAPSVVEKNGLYYLIFAVNDIQSDDEEGGLEVAVSENPEGPFVNHIGTHLIGKFINGAQPIDAHFFKDDDGKIYLFYGGWGHCNVALMNEEMNGFEPLPDGSMFKEITPEDYKEAPCMFRRDGKYYFMWSAGAWGDDTYRVVSTVIDKPYDKPENADTILVSDYDVAKSPGHNGYIEDVDGQFYIVYHRRPLEKTIRHCRSLAIDKMNFTQDGKIAKIQMTKGE
ncbi:MAG: glycoside hydrolase family 43 protein [Clostridia bacterium]|nr:glycoside hydrolase family 43 protein [Clostridia bacterium]